MNAAPCEPVTICVICYGDHPELAENFLARLYRLTDTRQFVLRAGLNEVSPATRRLFVDYSEKFGNIDLFEETANIFKAPLMRRMFHQPPLAGEWVIWFDDDSFPTRGDWLQRLLIKIEREPKIALWGVGYALWRKDDEIEEFIKAAPWYRGLPLKRSPDPNGCEAWRFHFATGGFWAAKVGAVRALDWPDRRLIQANDDFIFGEALRQNGCLLGNFEYGFEVNRHSRRNPAALEVRELPDVIARKHPGRQAAETR